MESKKFITASDLQWETFGPGLQRMILGYTDDLMVVRVKFEKDGIAAMHALK